MAKEMSETDAARGLSVWEQNVADVRALRRVAMDLRALLRSRGMPQDDPEVATLLEDATALERVASWVGNRLLMGSAQ
jgi:hypothetical protein